MHHRVRGMFGSVLGGAALLGGMAMGCAPGAGGDPAEKVQSTAQPLIVADPTPAPDFPDSAAAERRRFNCEGSLALYAPNGPAGNQIVYAPSGEDYVALPTTVPDGGSTDPLQTTYTHGYTYGDCADESSLNCQLAGDFFGIPSANGFKYDVKQILSFSCPPVTATCRPSATGLPCVPQGQCTGTTTEQDWYLESLQRVDQSWSYYPFWHDPAPNTIRPWCIGGGCVAGEAPLLDPLSHPPYASAGCSGNACYDSADWSMLWNLGWTYSYQEPPIVAPIIPPVLPPNENGTSAIQSTIHECAAIYVVNAGGGLQLLDYFVAAERHDPNGHPW
jgi:hypothetical protein